MEKRLEMKKELLESAVPLMKYLEEHYVDGIVTVTKNEARLEIPTTVVGFDKNNLEYWYTN